MRKPTPQDYGLTDEDVARISAVEKQLWTNIQSLESVALFATGLPCAIYLWSVGFKGANTGAFVALAVAWLFQDASTYLPRIIVKLKHKNYDRYDQFRKSNEEFESWFRRTQRQFWEQMDGRTFEREVRNLIQRLGNRAEVVGGANDGGIDIVVGDGTVIQCKAHKTAVSPAVARELYGAMIAFGARRAVLVSLNGFTSGVREFVRNKPIELWAVDDLVGMQKRLAG